MTVLSFSDVISLNAFSFPNYFVCFCSIDKYNMFCQSSTTYSDNFFLL